MSKNMRTVRFVVTMIAMCVMLFGGSQCSKNIQADEGNVPLGHWTFFQGGVVSIDEPYNAGYINSVTMDVSREQIWNWKRADGTLVDLASQEKTAAYLSPGFTIDIERNGWYCMWGGVTGYGINRINPYSIQGYVKTPMEAGHTYTVEFTAKASSSKYMYVNFECLLQGSESVSTPYGEVGLMDGSSRPIIKLDTTEQVFTYQFTNWKEGNELTTRFMLGAFPAQYDFDGTDISDVITQIEVDWKGTVSISDFKVIDNGKHQQFAETPQQPIEQPTTKKVDSTNGATRQVKNQTVKRVSLGRAVIKKATKKKKARTASVMLKKINGAKGYCIRVSTNKRFVKKNTLEIYSKKNNMKINKLVPNKIYYIQARAYCSQNGKRVYGKWSMIKPIVNQ